MLLMKISYKYLLYLLYLLNIFYKRTLFPKTYPEFQTKFDTLCQVDREKPPTDLNMIEIDQICSSYAQIIEIFPELVDYNHRTNPSL